MALLRMKFLTGLTGDFYQEVINGELKRLFDIDGNEITLPDNDGKGVSYTKSDSPSDVPSWYVEPTQGQ